RRERRRRGRLPEPVRFLHPTAPRGHPEDRVRPSRPRLTGYQNWIQNNRGFDSVRRVTGAPAVTSSTSSDRIARRPWRTALVVTIGSAMTILDTTVVNVALFTLADDFQASVAQIQWVATAYLLALATVIPASGWAARRLGARRVYLASLLV